MSVPPPGPDVVAAPDRTTRRLRIASWAVFLTLVVFVVMTDRDSLEHLGMLVGAVIVILGFDVKLPWAGK